MGSKFSKNGGYTLIELIIVMAIIGILFSVSYPNFLKILSQYQLRSAANQLVTDMRWVRQESIYGRAKRVKIYFDKDENYYAILDTTIRREERKLPKGVFFHDVPLSNPLLTFSLIGAPSEAGRIVLKNSYGDFCYIYFMPSTGRIRIAYEELEGE